MLQKASRKWKNLYVESSSPSNSSKGSKRQKNIANSRKAQKVEKTSPYFLFSRFSLLNILFRAILCNFTILNLCLENTAKKTHLQQKYEKAKNWIFFHKIAQRSEKEIQKCKKDFPRTNNFLKDLHN